jgi:hypothetical protein
MSCGTRLKGTREETAYHEAGHATIDLIYGITPQFLLLSDQNGEFSGECFSCVPTGQAHASWRGEKAVAGVLAQALYAGWRQLACQSPSLSAANAIELARFFLRSPDATATCVVQVSDESSKQLCQMDLCSFYSNADYLHFRVAVVELTTQRLNGQVLRGDEPECLPDAEQCLARCMCYLNDPFVWQQLSYLAEDLLTSDAVIAHMIGRDRIEAAAGLLSGYSARRTQSCT